MPYYEYEYTTKAGETKRVEKLFPMGKAPDFVIERDSEDNRGYRARRIISANARTPNLWK